MKEIQMAKYWEAGPNQTIQCLLCPHHCVIQPDQRGLCKVRENDSGQLLAKSYGEISCLALDPIEKKPLRHFHPGKRILSFGSYGCNLKCQHCQNFDISQFVPHVVAWTADELVNKALSLDQCIGIAATYNEPTIQLEYVLDVFYLAKANHLKTVVVSNGYIEEEPLHALMAVTDAFNIDLKGFDESFYTNICKGHLAPVMKTLEQISRNPKVHLEVTCLLIPGLNDSIETLEQQFKYLGELSKDMPVHISRYFPRYQMSIQETPLERLELAYKIAKKYLNVVYIGNV